MNFTLSPSAQALIAQVRHFVNERLIPLESDPTAYDDHENINLASLATLRGEAKAQGLWNVQLSPEWGGLGLSFVEMAAVYEEMNRSIFGPPCFNAQPPDDGTMMVLAKVGTQAQRARFLRPLTTGDARSAFAMTEPAPGAGSDPTMMRTTAVKHGDTWQINGHKWFTTGAGVAKVFIIVARTSDDPRRGLTAFLLDNPEAPGFRVGRRIPIMGPEEHGGHCELHFEGLEIPDSHRLMGVGEGLKLCQIRLGPARLTHCMRWLGLARRAMEICAPYVQSREGFGVRLAERESVQMALGQVAFDIEVGRLLTMKAAWLLDQGDRAKTAISMAKIHVADTLHRAVDTAIQLMGAKGYSKDTPLEWMYRYARQARLVDGASEVHRMVISRSYFKEGADFFHWRTGE